MSKTNTLTSHHPERRSSRVDKMNSRSFLFKSKHNSSASKFFKKFSSKKRRNLLRQSKEEKI